MHVKRFEDAKPYEAPNHRGVVGLRLQGFEPGGPTNQWLGFSQFLPGGGAGPDSTPFEKVYLVLEGHMTIIIDGAETVLGPMDSCTIAPGEVRSVAAQPLERELVVGQLVGIIGAEGGRQRLLIAGRGGDRRRVLRRQVHQTLKSIRH